MRVTSKFPDDQQLLLNQGAFISKQNVHQTEPFIVTNKREYLVTSQPDNRKKDEELKLHMLFKETKDGYVDSSDLIDGENKGKQPQHNTKNKTMNPMDSKSSNSTF